MTGRGSASADGAETVQNPNGRSRGVCVKYLKSNGRMRIGFDRRVWYAGCLSVQCSMACGGLASQCSMGCVAL